MQSGVTLAFIANPESLRRLAESASVIPLSPLIQPDAKRLVVPRPEALLSDPEFREIEEGARELADNWWKAARTHAFFWGRLNLAACFSYELRFVARDVLKADLILKRAIERYSPSDLAVDVGPVREPLGPYPYLSAIGSQIARYAVSSDLPLKELRTDKKTPRRARGATLVRAYGALASRKAIARLESGHPIVGLGPFPEVFGPVAAACKAAHHELVALSSRDAPLRDDPSHGLYYTPVENLLAAEEIRKAHAFAEACVGAAPAVLLEHGGPPVGKEAEVEFLLDVKRRLRLRIEELVRLCIAFEKGVGRASRLLMLETHSPMAKAAVGLARERGVPVTVIQHGVIADPESYRETDADAVAAWGVVDANWFSSNLPPKVKVAATGNPRYDRLAAIAPDARGGVERISPRLRPVLFASAPFGHLHAGDSLWDHYALQSAAVEACLRIPEALLIFKRHPAERAGRLPGVASSGHPRIREAVGGDTFALIRACEAVITLGSSVAVEAIYLGKPTVFLGPANPQSPFHPPEEGAGMRALDSNELEAQIRRLLTDQRHREEILRGQREYLTRNYAPLDGHAADRVAAVFA